MSVCVALVTVLVAASSARRELADDRKVAGPQSGSDDGAVRPSGAGFGQGLGGAGRRQHRRGFPAGHAPVGFRWLPVNSCKRPGVNTSLYRRRVPDMTMSEPTTCGRATRPARLRSARACPQSAISFLGHRKAQTTARYAFLARETVQASKAIATRGDGVVFARHRHAVRNRVVHR